MVIKTKILAVLRALNSVIWYRYQMLQQGEQQASNFVVSREGLRELMQDFGIDPSDYPTIVSILKSTALLTAANQETLRNPSAYTPGASEPWRTYFPSADQGIQGMSGKWIEGIAEEIGFNLTESPTKEDYEMAHKLIKVLGKSFIQEEEMKKLFSKTYLARVVSDKINKDLGMFGSELLYRGLHDLSDDAFKILSTPNESWDIERGVSTSMDRNIAGEFSQKGQTAKPKAIIVIRNPNKQGYVINKTSKFPNESEILLSGTLRIDSFELRTMAYIVEENYESYICVIKNHPFFGVSIEFRSEENGPAVFTPVDNKDKFYDSLFQKQGVIKAELYSNKQRGTSTYTIQVGKDAGHGPMVVAYATLK